MSSEFKLEERIRVTVCPSFDKKRKLVITCRPGFTASDFEHVVCSKLGIAGVEKFLTNPPRWDAEIDFEDVGCRRGNTVCLVGRDASVVCTQSG